tara:strand:- start:1687 stop:2898 length:1212 start_codon:yes stop_codon:yes gene_type:complete
MILNRKVFQNAALYFYAFSINFESIDILGRGVAGTFSISRLAGILYLFLILPSFLIFFSFKRSFYFLWPMIVFVIILTIISIININSFSSRIFDLAFLLNFFIFIGMLNHVQKDSLVLDKALLIYSLGAFIPAMSIFLGFGESTLYKDDVVRTVAFGANSNDLAIKLAIAIIVLGSHIIFNPLKITKLRYFVFPLIFILLFALLSTASRTGILALLAAPMIWFFLKTITSENKFQSFLSGLFLSIIILLPIIFIALQSSSLISRFSLIGEGNFGGREVLWLAYAIMISENFLFGYGLSGTDLVTFQYFGYAGETPHNIILQVLIYAGIPGLIFFFLFIFRIFKACYLLFRDRGILLPSLLASPLLGYFMLTQSISEKIVWIMMAYIAGIYLFKNMEKPLENSK